MELILYCATPNDAILNELYSWGEVPYDWIAERVNEFNELAAKCGTEPLGQYSTLPDAKASEWSHVFVLPAEPEAAILNHPMVHHFNARLAAVPASAFRIECVHHDVRCIAFM